MFVNPLCHVAPDPKDLERNRQVEPEGERLREELEEWLRKNKIVGIRLDTEHHQVSIQSAHLPPRIKPILRLWGSIYVRDEPENNVESVPVKRRIILEDAI